MFIVKGKFKLGENYQNFTLKIDAINEQLAIEKAYSKIGSNHKCKRRFIKIKGVEIAK